MTHVSLKKYKKKSAELDCQNSNVTTVTECILNVAKTLSLFHGKYGCLCKPLSEVIFITHNSSMSDSYRRVKIKNALIKLTYMQVFTTNKITN
jgi:hypothetical protein